ncbi:hypothetical protein MDOR_37700 [Mycolicibacterium doricum]|uniref:Transposase DDE domain-containing protein n=1 Tax=Mycolicibacterium doricum TaxID=126673 RepID=A0A7I7VZ14_9MYCO|nr:hypothetical protein MDOR_37700 [Mycolicibacterium doricum]
MQSSHTFTVGSAVFDEDNLVSAAGLVPVLELAEQSGLSGLIDEHVDLRSTRVKSGAVNPAGKLTSIIAAMACGADTIDDADLLRAGGTPRVFDEVYAPSTLGTFLREFTFGHASQLAVVVRAHLAALAARTPLLLGHRGARLHRHRLAAAPGSTATRNRVPLLGTPRSPAARCCALVCPRRSAPSRRRRPRRSSPRRSYA